MVCRALAVGAVLVAGVAGCGSSVTGCFDGPSDFVVAAAMERAADGTILVASAWGKADEGSCHYVRRVGGVHSIAPDGDVSVRDLPGQPGLHLAVGDAAAIVSGGEWYAGGIGGNVGHSPGPEPPFYRVLLEGLDATEVTVPAGIRRRLFSAGGRVFLLAGSTLHRDEGGGVFTQVALPADVVAVTGAAGALFASLQTGDVVAVDPITLSVSATYGACATQSIAPFGGGRLALVCEQGIGVVSTATPEPFAVLSTGERFVGVWGGALADAALVTTTGGMTRVFTIASGAQGAISGTVFDAELTEDAGYAVLTEAPWAFEGALMRIPYDDGLATELVQSLWGPIQVERDESGALVVATERWLRRLDPATGLELATPQELDPPPMFDPPFPL